MDATDAQMICKLDQAWATMRPFLDDLRCLIESEALQKCPCRGCAVIEMACRIVAAELIARERGLCN